MLTQKEIKKIFAEASAIITGDHFVYAKKPDGWYHGYGYVNKDAIYPFTDAVSTLCKQIATHFWAIGYHSGDKIEVVVGPTVGGVALAQWTTYWLKKLYHGENPTGYQVLAVCADEEDVLENQTINEPCRVHNENNFLCEFLASGNVKIHFNLGLQVQSIEFSTKVGTKRVIKRGYDQHVKGKRCLIVEDVINSGATVAKTRDAIIAVGGEIVGVGCLCNRSGGKVTAETLEVPDLFSLLDVNMQMFKEDECPICRERGRGSVRLDLGKGKEFLARIGINPGDR